MHIIRSSSHITAHHKVSPQQTPSSKLCKDCKHFKSDPTGARFGKCSLYGKQNLVDGKIEYSYASIAREYECRGDYYDKKQSTFEHLKESLSKLQMSTDKK